MRFLVELEKGDTLSDLDGEVGFELAKRVMVETQGEGRAAEIIESVGEESLIIMLAEKFLEKHLLTTESLFIELDGSSALQVGQVVKVQSTTRPGVVWDVVVDPSGHAISCTCEAGRFGNACKHLKQAEALVAV